MIYFIELWNPNQKWLDLSKTDRKAYLEKVAAATADIVSQGVEILTWTSNDKETSVRGGYDYFAIWKFPNQALADTFQKLVEGAGWYNYFDQINIKGNEESVQSGLDHLLNYA